MPRQGATGGAERGEHSLLGARAEAQRPAHVASPLPWPTRHTPPSAMPTATTEPAQPPPAPPALRRQLLLDHHLCGDARMVGPRQPERGPPPHALVPRHDVLQRGKHRVAHVQLPRDVGRGHRHHKGLACGSSSSRWCGSVAWRVGSWVQGVWQRSQEKSVPRPRAAQTQPQNTAAPAVQCQPRMCQPATCLALLDLDGRSRWPPTTGTVAPRWQRGQSSLAALSSHCRCCCWCLLRPQCQCCWRGQWRWLPLPGARQQQCWLPLLLSRAAPPAAAGAGWPASQPAPLRSALPICTGCAGPGRC